MSLFHGKSERGMVSPGHLTQIYYAREAEAKLLAAET